MKWKKDCLLYLFNYSHVIYCKHTHTLTQTYKMLSLSTFRYTRRFHNTPTALQGGRSSKDDDGGTGWKGFGRSSVPSAGSAYDNKEFQEHDYLSEEQKKTVRKLKEEIEEHIDFDPKKGESFQSGRSKIKDTKDKNEDE